MLEVLGNTIISIIHTTGYTGVFVLMTLESALIPIPSEVTMPFAGSLVSTGVFNFWLLGFIGGLGNLFGSLIAYYIGLKGEKTVRHLIKTYGKFILVKEKEFDLAESWFKKYGDGIVFFSRVMPVLRTFVSLPAGIAKTPIKKFIIYTLVGSLIWSYVLEYLGVVLGNNWHILGAYFHKFDFAIAAVLGVCVILYLYHHFKKD